MVLFFFFDKNPIVLIELICKFLFTKIVDHEAIVELDDHLLIGSNRAQSNFFSQYRDLCQIIFQRLAVKLAEKNIFVQIKQFILVFVFTFEYFFYSFVKSDEIIV
jgi:hypothetical protein